MDIKSKIQKLQQKLTGNVFEDSSIQEEILRLKAKLSGTETNANSCDVEHCENCGS